jgi:ArsR family transcriptional regulator
VKLDDRPDPECDADEGDERATHNLAIPFNRSAQASKKATRFRATNHHNFDIRQNVLDMSDPLYILIIGKITESDPGMEKKGAIAALGALAQETRLDLFRLLVTVGPNGLPAGVIADRLGVLPASLTFHLKELQHAGLITQRRLSRQLIYSAEYGAMTDLLAYLTENCCGKGASCAPPCNPADAFNTGETDEAPARARQR